MDIGTEENDAFVHMNNIVIHQQSSSASGFTIVATIIGVVVSIISLFFTALTYLREERFSAVFSAESVT